MSIILTKTIIYFKLSKTVDKHGRNVNKHRFFSPAIYIKVKYGVKSHLCMNLPGVLKDQIPNNTNTWYTIIWKNNSQWTEGKQKLRQIVMK